MVKTMNGAVGHVVSEPTGTGNIDTLSLNNVCLFGNYRVVSLMVGKGFSLT